MSDRLSMKILYRKLIFLMFPVFLLAGFEASAASANEANSDWFYLGNNLEMQHHAELDQINTDSVQNLGLAWSVDLLTKGGLVGNPLINDGVIFQSGSQGKVFAHDIRTGKLLWEYTYEYELKNSPFAAVWGSLHNRGLALWEDLAITSTGDCHLIALDQKTGKLRWKAKSCEPEDLYSITAAPRVGEGLVFTGNACLDSGQNRGYVDAFNTADGEHVWRFYTVPGDPSKPFESELYRHAAETWGKDWYQYTRGCGSVWDAMTYDPGTGMLFIGVGGPTPFNPQLRGKDAGDELFSNSIVALEAKSGKYLWHFKQVPNDGWNFDSSVGIMVAGLPVGDQNKRVVISVPKNGFIYVLDAGTGEFISGNNYVEVNWTTGLDDTGRPIFSEEAKYWVKAGGKAVTRPGPGGSHNWEPMALNPVDKTLYIPAIVMPTLTVNNPKAAVGGVSMDFYYGGLGENAQSRGELIAWDLITQSPKWKHKETYPLNSGLLHTSGNIVVQGTADGFLNIFNAETGEKLWHRQVGGAIRAAASTVMVDGKQYIILTSGNGSSSVTGNYFSRYAGTPESRTQPRLLAFALGGNAPLPALDPVPAVARPLHPRFDEKLAELGGKRFEEYYCVDCHGLEAVSSAGTIPDLRYSRLVNLQYVKSVLKDGVLEATGMPRFDYIEDGDIEAIYAYLINRAWDLYEGKEDARDKNQNAADD